MPSWHTPADFYLFPRMKSAWKGRHFCDATDIIKNAMEELKGFQKMTSRNVFDTFTVYGRNV